MIGRVAQQIERHDDVHHGRVDGGHAVGVARALEHPLLGLLDGAAADGSGAVFFPELQNVVQVQEHVAPGEAAAELRKLGRFRLGEQLLEVESLRDRAPRVGGMHDRERDHDGARPRRHLVDEIAEQHDLGRNGGAAVAGIQIEQAEVDLDVAVGRLQAAQRQDALAGASQARIVHIQTGELQRKIRLHRGADVGRALRINIEPAVRQLTRENRFAPLCRSAAAWADSIRRATGGCSQSWRRM